MKNTHSDSPKHPHTHPHESSHKHLNHTQQTDKRANRLTSQLLIITSVVFALLIMLASYFVSSHDLSEIIILLIIAVWLIPFTYFSRKLNNERAE